eukprot:COSAG01_NODE_7960_length_2970_cov_1.416203_4_plen_83_part_01
MDRLQDRNGWLTARGLAPRVLAQPLHNPARQRLHLPAPGAPEPPAPFSARPGRGGAGKLGKRSRNAGETEKNAGETGKRSGVG